VGGVTTTRKSEACFRGGKKFSVFKLVPKKKKSPSAAPSEKLRGRVCSSSAVYAAQKNELLVSLGEKERPA